MVPHFMKFRFFSLAIIILAASGSVWAQQSVTLSERERALQLCEQSNFDAAFDALQDAVRKNENDSEAWHCLGLASLAKNKKSDARQAFRSSVNAELRTFGRLRVAHSPETPVDRSQNAGRFETAVKSAEKYIELTSNASSDERDELETLRWYRDFYKGLPQGEEIVPSKEITTRIRVINKPPPDFRGIRSAGTVSLRAVFSADGTVKHILVTRKLDPEFDHACLLAAQRVEFTPALKDGKPVSMILELEYARHIY
jgi:tetratricopeptide (TPR) repeat protein